ncbi:MAG: inositol 2-dehydrogenase [Thermomicrobiales bacterium]
MTTIGIGLLGAGRIGSLHAANVVRRLPTARLVAVTDAFRPVAEACAAAFPGVAVADSAGAVFARPDIDAVLICTSTDTHAGLIALAAAAGKHVFCEKPIALDLAEIDGALAAVSRAGVNLQIGFNRRFDPTFARVRRAIADGEIGRPELLHIVSRDPAPPPLEYIRRSGGLFIDMAIHDFDMARFLIADEVESVHATGAVLVDPAIGEAGDIDSAVTVLRFRGGAIGTIQNSRRATYGYDQRVDVLGSLGAVATGNVFANQATVSDAAGIRRDPPLHFFLQRYQESFVAELTAFVEAIKTGGSPPVTGADGRAPVVLALAAARSLAEGRPVRTAELG